MVHFQDQFSRSTFRINFQGRVSGLIASVRFQGTYRGKISGPTWTWFLWNFRVSVCDQFFFSNFQIFMAWFFIFDFSYPIGRKCGRSREWNRDTITTCAKLGVTWITTKAIRRYDASTTRKTATKGKLFLFIKINY